MKGKSIKRFLFAVAFCFMFFNSNSLKAEAKELPTDSVILCDDTTSEATTTSTSTEEDIDNLNDFSITMDENGNITNTLENGTGGESKSWNKLFEKYKKAIAGVGGILTITFIFFFMKNFAVLGASSNNPNARKDALTACLYTAIGAVLCGSATLVTAIFWNFFS